VLDYSTRILLVDDSISSQKVLSKYFQDLGYKNFEVCSDGEQALKWLTVSKPEFGLVFTDWHMPNMTGLELLERIRQSENPKIKKIPVLLGTAERKVEEIKRAIAAGVNGYIVKPYSTETIQKAIEKLKLPTPDNEKANQK
jgi:two-component system chemotaxis response regulator CheY